MSKPTKFERKWGSVYILWSIKFASWAGVKGDRATLNPSFDSRLPATEDAILDKTDPTAKAQTKALLQNAIALDAMVQFMGKMEDIHRLLLSMKEDADWPTRKAWKTSLLDIVKYSRLGMKQQKDALWGTHILEDTSDWRVDIQRGM